MAETKTILGGWYTHSLLTREFASLTPTGIETHLGPVDRPMNDLGQPDGPLFIDVTNVGGFRIAGKGANSFITWEREPDGVWTRHPDACGNYSVMYDLDGILHISDCSIGTQGWRYVAPDGSLVPGDVAMLLDGINEYTDLGDGILVGQGNTSGGVVVRIDGVKRVLAEGACYDIKARRKGNDVTISFYLVAPDGLSAHIWWGTVDELRQLKELVIPAPEPKPEPKPTMEAPQITVISWDSELVAGKNWKATFSTNGITFEVIKNEKDQLVFTAVNAAGSTATGAVRQLKLTPVVGEPTPVPEPPPVPKPIPQPVPSKGGRFIVAPNLKVKDLKEIINEDALRHVDKLQLYVQEVMDDSQLNNWAGLKAAGVFAKLRALGIGLGIEGGAVKPEDPFAESNTNSLETMFKRVEEAGGVVDYISMDEPLTSGQKLRQTPQAVAASVSKFIAKSKELRPEVKVNWIEAFPQVSLAEMQAFWNALTVKPDGIHFDIAWKELRTANDAAAAINFAKSINLTYGIIINSTEDPVTTDEQHDVSVRASAQRAWAIAPDMPHVIVQSWAFRTGGVQDVPNNLGQFGLLATFESVHDTFSGTVPVPTPIPNPPQESKVLKSTVSEDPIVIKTVKPVAGTKLSTLILPDDKVYSCQPDGSDDVRPAGTEGDFEKCRVSGNLATFKPVKAENKFYTKPFVETEEL